MIKNIKINKGFTLIELLVVVVIIGILSSVGLLHIMVIQMEQKEMQH